MRGHEEQLERCCQAYPFPATAFRVAFIWFERSISLLTRPPGSSRGEVLPKNHVRRSVTKEDPRTMEGMLPAMLAYRVRWVYSLQMGAATVEERRLAYLGGRTGSDDPRGRTDESPPGGM